MAKVFGVSRSGLYYWIDNRHKVTQRNEYRKQFDSKVREVFDDKKNAMVQGVFKKNLRQMVISTM